jgi:hypothetical protein
VKWERATKCAKIKEQNLNGIFEGKKNTFLSSNKKTNFGFSVSFCEAAASLKKYILSQLLGQNLKLALTSKIIQKLQKPGF